MAADNSLKIIIRMPKVSLKVGLSTSAIWDRLNTKSPRYDPSFPKPIKLSGSLNRGRTAVGWLESEVDDWLHERLLARI